MDSIETLDRDGKAVRGRERVTYWCAEGVHGDNRRVQYMGMTLREIREAGGEPFSFEGRCGGSMRSGLSFDGVEMACECACHAV